MTINNRQAFDRSQWDWSVLDGCFKRGIRVTDIDFAVECGGILLVLETKGPGVLIKHGQELALKAMALSSYHTVIVIWGQPGSPERLRWITKTEDFTVDADLTTLRKWVSHWFAYADRYNGTHGARIVPKPGA